MYTKPKVSMLAPSMYILLRSNNKKTAEAAAVSALTLSAQASAG